MIELSAIHLRYRTLLSRFCFLWVACLVLTGCGKDAVMPESVASSSNLGLSLCLGFPNPLTVTTRTNPVRNGIELKDVRVLQFPVTTGGEAKNKLYSEAESGSPDWYTQETDGGLITVNTGVDDFTNVDCRFYIVVNAGSNLSAVVAENALKSYSLDFADITKEPDILTFGPVDYTKVEGSTKPVALLAKLRRTYAKVTVKYTLATGIEITSVDIENVPDKIYPFPEVSAGGSSSSVSSVGYLPASSIVPASSKEVTFYMPENLKGNGSAITETDKNLPAKGPGGTLDGCTCIILKGTYDYYPEDADSAPIEVEYRFYPGSDMVRNYDVERGKYYTLTVNLKGANSADARVNITDGNVFTFDDPDNVNNGMDFN